MLSLQRKIVFFFCITAVYLFLAGCEAPLNLDGVEREKTQVVHRYDELQQATHSRELVVVVGSAGAVLLSDNFGKQWRRLELAGRPSLIDVDACSDDHFIALDAARKLWVSDKLASQWQQVDVATEEVVLALTCDAHNNYWVVAGFSTILSSTDGGQNWQETSQGEDVQLTSIQFVNESTGYITGEFGTVLKTVDGGDYWERIMDLPGEFYPQAALFLDAQQGWVVGLNGAIFHTADGGNSWNAQDSGTQMPFYGITSLGDQLYAVGENGQVIRYYQGAWQPLKHDQHVRSYLRAATAVDDNLVVAGGSGALFSLSLTN